MYTAMVNMKAYSLVIYQIQRNKIVSRMYQAWDGHQRSKTAAHIEESHLFKLSECQPSENSMLELATARRGLCVSDPRDMVSAHVRFASDGQDGDLKVDYSKTCQEVFVDFARFIAYKYGGGYILEYMENTQSHLCRNDLPSWVPDWTVSFLSPIKSPK